MFSCFSNLLGANNYHEKPKTDPKINCILRSEVLGIGTLMPHLLGFLVWDAQKQAGSGPVRGLGVGYHILTSTSPNFKII